jgi:hypothetical protein
MSSALTELKYSREEIEPSLHTDVEMLDDRFSALFRFEVSASRQPYCSKISVSVCLCVFSNVVLEAVL